MFAPNRLLSLVFLASLVAGLSTAIPAEPQEDATPIAERPITASEYGVVLNLSGKQRMLSQKMSKEVMLIALGEDVAGNLDNLKATAELFDKTLKGLRSGSEELRLPPTFSKRILKQLGKIDEIWDGFSMAVDQVIEAESASPEAVAQIAAENLPLLKEMNKCVGLYEKEASKSGLEADPGLAVTLNLSGKQRMLTQKMSKEFLLIAYGHEVEENQLNLLETYTLFERTLKGLVDGDETLDLPGTEDKEIRAQLEVVQDLWSEFKPLVEAATRTGAKPSAADIAAIAAANLPLLKNMNAAVGMYEAAAAK
jgi:hypothetical protein